MMSSDLKKTEFIVAVSLIRVEDSLNSFYEEGDINYFCFKKRS